MTEELEVPAPPEDDPNRELTASEIRQWKHDMFEVLFSLHAVLHDIRAALRANRVDMVEKPKRSKPAVKAGRAVRRKR